MAGGKAGSRRHQRTRADQGALANDGTAQQNRAHPNQRAIAHATRMEDRAVAHRYVSTHDRGNAVVRVNNGVVLNVGVGADHDRFNIPPQNRPRPNRCPRPEEHRTNDLGGGMDKRRP